MRIAHLSDLHLLNLEGAVPHRLFNKRLTGYLNLRFHRKSVHRPAVARAVGKAIREAGVDHVAITGDVSNLALEKEFELVQRFVEVDLGSSPDHVSIVPGNHDMYTRGAHRARRFERHFAPYLTSDIPVAEGHSFPFVRLRGAAAIIGLSTAVPRLPFVASGHLGHRQISALKEILAHPEVKRRTPVLLQHHPWHNPVGRVHALLEGLTDALAEAEALADVARGLLLHGHLHRRVHRSVRTASGAIDAVGATSASLVHRDAARMAGFNVYEIGDGGEVQAIESHRVDPETLTWCATPIPKEG